jgi:hypothetical protein
VSNGDVIDLLAQRDGRALLEAALAVGRLTTESSPDQTRLQHAVLGAVHYTLMRQMSDYLTTLDRLGADINDRVIILHSIYQL